MANELMGAREHSGLAAIPLFRQLSPAALEKIAAKMARSLSRRAILFFWMCYHVGAHLPSAKVLQTCTLAPAVSVRQSTH